MIRSLVQTRRGNRRVELSLTECSADPPRRAQVPAIYRSILVRSRIGAGTLVDASHSWFSDSNITGCGADSDIRFAFAPRFARIPTNNRDQNIVNASDAVRVILNCRSTLEGRAGAGDAQVEEDRTPA
jgi:hypothetical protein